MLLENVRAKYYREHPEAVEAMKNSQFGAKVDAVIESEVDNMMAKKAKLTGRNLDRLMNNIDGAMEGDAAEPKSKADYSEYSAMSALSQVSASSQKHKERMQR